MHSEVCEYVQESVNVYSDSVCVCNHVCECVKVCHLISSAFCFLCVILGLYVRDHVTLFN